MLNDINLKEAPHNSGAYLFISNNEVIYVGSSKNLYQRMTEHNTCIRKGSNHGYKQDFYQFLQSNQFTIEFQLADDYKQLEQDLIEKHNPKYNSHRAYTGLGARKDRKIEYEKERYQKFKEEILEQRKQHYESHKEEKLKQQKKYKNQLCNYNGETLTLHALLQRFGRQGIPHPTIEAKKYLIR